MKIIEVVTDNIGDIKTIIEILNGFIPEANADFIRDGKKYSEQLSKKKPIKKTDTDDQSYGRSEAQNDEMNSNDSEDFDEAKDKHKHKKKSALVRAKKSQHDSDDENDEHDENVNEEEEESTKSSKKSKKTEKTKKSKKTKKEVKGKKKNKHDHGAESENDEKEENRGEIKILTADPNQVMITFIVLKGSAFKKFNVLPDKYSVGLNLDELYKYIKNVDKEGTMSIHIDSDDTQHIIFEVQSDNSTQESICELRVLNLSNKKDRRIEANVAMAVRINCQAFHKACKDLLQFSQFVEITCDPTQFVITCKGDLSNQCRIFKANGTQNGVIIKTIKRDDDDAPNIIRLIFDLKYINSMYKCYSLCEDMEIYLNTDSVMFLKYGIKLMGELVVGIAPSGKNKDKVDNYDENDEQYYPDDDEIIIK
jgi:hypothetical protein